ncbi:magnesium transporter [Aggregatilinea lenta]|uniref:magnesium transporter n=1 Tax=Aggregatilinea lenta TaxID=913108 RepID=UPI0013C36F26|nr:magnesium transporter [Aggregatilinea lenta]
METPILDDILARVRDALERDDIADAVNVLEGMRPPDQAELFAELEDDHQLALLPELDPTDSADILEKLDEAEAAELASALSTETLAHIIDEMEPDEAADLLGDIDPDQARDVLAAMDDSDEIHPLMLHADDSAGGLMTSDFLALRRRMTAGEALQAIRDWQPESESIYHLFVVDAQNTLVGVVSLRQLILAGPTTPLTDLMDSDVISVTVGTDQEECARVMSRYDLVALPVVDAQRKLVGVVTIDDVVDVLVDEATEDIQRMGGAQPLNRSYLESSVTRVMRTRISWLLMLFVTESLTGTVLRHFEGELSQVVALSFFVPLLIGTGGNAGSQTTSTIIRALAVGELKWSDAMHALWHELRVGILLGLGMAIVAYVRALTWGTSSDLALTISLTIFTIVVWANGLGSLLPMLATRLHIDPTVVSGPVMSTLVDATGLFIYFSIARIIMGL